MSRTTLTVAGLALVFSGFACTSPSQQGRAERPEAIRSTDRPAQFNLSDFSLRIIQVPPGHRDDLRETITMDGSGSVRYELDDAGRLEQSEFTLTYHHLTSLMSHLYATDFHLYPEEYERVGLGFSDDGRAGESFTRISSASRTELRVQIADYLKIVRWRGSGPFREFVDRMNQMLSENDVQSLRMSQSTERR